MTDVGAQAAAVAAPTLPPAAAAVMLPLLLIAGTGHGLSFGPIVNRMAARIQPTQAPTLSGLVTTSIQLSIVVGIATLGTIYLAAGNSDGIGYVAVAVSAVTAAACSVQLARRR